MQVFQSPFCLVWADGSPVEFQRYAAFLLSTWNIIGNGTACAMPLSELTDAHRAEHNIIYLGVPMEQVPLPESIPMAWDELNVTVYGVDRPAAALGFIFPEGDRLGAVFTTTRTHEYLRFRLSPFNSRFWIPDFLVWADGGAQAAGFFDSDWNFNAALSLP